MQPGWSLLIWCGRCFVYSNLYQFNQKSKKKYLFSKTKLPSGKITQQLLKDYRVGIIAVMLKRELFKKNKFNKNYNIIGDFDFFIRLSRNEILHGRIAISVLLFVLFLEIVSKNKYFLDTIYRNWSDLNRT